MEPWFLVLLAGWFICNAVVAVTIAESERRIRHVMPLREYITGVVVITIGGVFVFVAYFLATLDWDRNIARRAQPPAPPTGAET